MPICDWPVQERPREKLLLHGPAQLSHAELLAIFFRVGPRGSTALDLARTALNHFGGLRPLLDSDLNTFTQIRGLGKSKYIELQAALEMGRRYLKESLKHNNVLHNTFDTHQFLMAKLRHHPHEVFAMLCLDSKNRVLDYRELFYGTINHATIYPRVIIKHALEHNAAAVIFAHNHPSGNAEPSQADRELTLELQRTLSHLDIQLLDHIIVGDTINASMADLGMLAF